MLYLEPEWLPLGAIEAAAETPMLFDPSVTSTVDLIHAALNDPADVLAAECGVLALRDLVQPQLKSPVDTASDAPLARRLRRLFDDRLEETFTIAEAAAQSGFHDQSHLTRHFRRTLGTTPGVFAA